MKTIKINATNEEIYYLESKDGLPIYIWKNEYAKSFYLSLNVNYGSIHTDFSIDNKTYHVPNGIAHFMEHIKFNIKNNVTANDLFDPLGSEINAFTTFQLTSYLVYGTSRIKDNLNALLDYVYNPYFTKKTINKEKGIIISEINMGEDQPFNKLFYEFNKCIFEKDKFRNLITGDIDDVKNINIEDIKLIYNTFYHPKNMFLIVTGNVNPYEIEDIVNKNLSNKKICKFKNPIILKTKESKKVYQSEKTINANVEVPKAKIGLKIPRSNFKNYDDIILNLLFNLILNSNFGETSALKEELLQNNLITYINTNRYVMDDYVILSITVESKYLDETIKRIVEKLNNLEMNEEDLKRKINSSIASFVTNYDNPEEVNNLLQNYLIYYKKIIPNTIDIYKTISLKDVKSVINNINTKEMVIVKMNNFK